MKALVSTANPARPAEVRDVDEPKAAADEAIVEVKAAAINRGELRLLATRQEGWRPGQDIAGTVARAAFDGQGPQAGERVVAVVDQAGWSERVAAPTSRLARLPDEVSFSQAATLGVAGLTALRALRTGGPLLGRRVLVTGASGGVGHFAVQLAAAGGAHVSALVSSPERGEWVRSLGASEVFVGLEALHGMFDLVLESVGGAVLSAAIRSADEGGKVVIFGNSSGEDATFGFRDFGGRPRISIESFFVYRSGERPTFGEDLGLMAGLIAEGKLRPEVGFETDWQEPVTALRALGDREVNGKAVLRFG
jgi:NADPH:quinone reductase